MKNILNIIILALLCNGGIAQKVPGYYKVLQGKVGAMEATLHLHIAGVKASGYLWFDKTPRPMQCYGSLNLAKDSLLISANANPLSINLNGIIKGDDFSGASILEKENNNMNTQATSTKKGTFSLHTIGGSHFTPFDYVYEEGNAKMPAHIKNESTAEYYAATVWPKPMAKKLLDAAIKSYINNEFGNKGPVKEPGKIFLAEKNKILNRWKSEMTKMNPKEAKDMGLSLSQETEENINVMYEDETVLTMAHFSYAFTGGAHGNFNSRLTSFKKSTGAVLKLSDVLSKEGIAMLPILLEAATRMQYGFDKNKTLEQNGLFVKKIEPSSNFYVAKGAIGFIYAPYELMSFSFGEPNIFIPASSLSKYIVMSVKN